MTMDLKEIDVDNDDIDVQDIDIYNDYDQLG